MSVNALSGLYLISTLHLMESTLNGQEHTVSMPSRAYTSFLRTLSLVKPVAFNKVSMPSRAYTSFLHPESRISLIRKNILCQCPLGLIPHFYSYNESCYSFNMPVSMPSRAYTSFLRGNSEKGFKKFTNVSMPSRAYTSFLQQTP